MAFVAAAACQRLQRAQPAGAQRYAHADQHGYGDRNLHRYSYMDGDKGSQPDGQPDRNQHRHFYTKSRAHLDAQHYAVSAIRLCLRQLGCG